MKFDGGISSEILTSHLMSILQIKMNFVKIISKYLSRSNMVLYVAYEVESTSLFGGFICFPQSSFLCMLCCMPP